MFNKNNHLNSDATIAVAMSGGIDSSVAAALLVEKGYKVIGLTMRLWFDPEVEGLSAQNCCSFEAVNDAKKVADKLGIPHYAINLKDIFKKEVVDYFIEEYASGRTPNPCVPCNRKIKFGAFLDSAIKVGADYLATGHYVRSAWDPTFKRYYLKKGHDLQKDQSYTLYRLTQKQLSYSCFPLGAYHKAQVRQKAKEMGFQIANKAESQEVCFIPNNDYRDFMIRQKGKFIPGPIKDTSGRELGIHKGLPFYTVGQRRGLGLTSNEPLYVVEIKPQENVLVVGTKEEIYSRELIAHQLNYMKIPPPLKAVSIKARIRYRAPEVPALLHPIDRQGRAKVEFSEPQAAVTPGQSIVFYQDEDVLGGGIILSAV